MKPPRKSCLLSVAVIWMALVGSTAYAQSQPPPVSAPVSGRMVILNVRVTDSMSHAVVDVNQDAFSVTEDGITQKITFFSKGGIPLTYGLVIDNSASMRSQLIAVLLTGTKIVNSNMPDDETFLVRFIGSDKIEVVQDLTSNKQPLIDGLNNLFVEGGQTALIDALYLSVEKLAKRKADNKLRRQALILITDGEDRRSFHKPAQLFDLLANNDIQIYVVGFTKELTGNNKIRASELLTRLADDTGGRVFFPQALGDLSRIADEIVNDIRTQYVIGYVPSGKGGDNAFHKVQVSIANNPQQDKRIAITRVGYSRAGKN